MDIATAKLLNVIVIILIMEELVKTSIAQKIVVIMVFVIRTWVIASVTNSGKERTAQRKYVLKTVQNMESVRMENANALKAGQEKPATLKNVLSIALIMEFALMEAVNASQDLVGKSANLTNARMSVLLKESAMKRVSVSVKKDGKVKIVQ